MKRKMDRYICDYYLCSYKWSMFRINNNFNYYNNHYSIDNYGDNYYIFNNYKYHKVIIDTSQNNK